MYDGSCEHIIAYKKEEGLDSYEIIHAFYVACLAKDSRRRKALDCLCMEHIVDDTKESEKLCRRYQRIHACLSCAYFGCYSLGHIHNHAKENGHILAMDTNFGNVYCFKCKDYQYDADFDDIARGQNLIAARKRGDELWEPSIEEAKLRKHIILDVASINGLRGIKNLGNTCYMSVIILSLVHAPLFRDYFLSLRHKCNIQNIPSEIQDSDGQRPMVTDGQRPLPNPVCFVCEMSEIVQEFYCGNLEAFSPDRLLYLVYLQGTEFRNPGQHDAHEFFMELLNYLHLHSQGLNVNVAGNNSCNCFFDTIFTGISFDEFTCQECKYQSTKSDTTEYKEIYLMSDVSSSQDDAKCVSSTSFQSFEYFIKKALTASVCKFCVECGKDIQHTKMITLKKLPLILNFHLQQNEKESAKHIHFPEFIDMTPFMTQSVPETNEDSPKNGLSKISRNKFYLFAVVEYLAGSKEYGSGGHYTAYVRRHETKWFNMSDHTVEEVALENVLNIRTATMLFYHKETLEYEDKIMLMNKI